MMINDSAQNLVRFEESVPEINPVAVVQQEYTEIDRTKTIDFQKSYDDLDYLVFAILPLASGNRVVLLRHEHSPNPGTEICVSNEQQNISSVILETLETLNLSIKDLTWVHSDYEQKLYEPIDSETTS